ncbi:MAG: amidase family protein [Thermomicrobiales bacterium]
MGVARERFTGYSEHTDAIFEAALEKLREAGAILVDPADIPTAKELTERPPTVLDYEFKADLNAYLATRPDLAVHSLADVIAYNQAHAAEEMPYYRQEIMERAEATAGLDDPAYLEALATNQRLAREEGIDAALQAHDLDALVAPTNAPAFTIDQINGNRGLGGSSTPAALAGYPLVTVPAGYAFGLPVNITFMGTAFSEPTLIRLAYAFEQHTKVWQPPQFIPTLELP